LTDEEIDAVSGDGWEESGLFDERDLAAIRWADRVTRNEAHADVDAEARARAIFSEAEFVELTLAASLFNFLNRFNDTMWLELDDGAPSGANLHIHRETFERYASAMYPSDGVA
jgi:alkylhydroperoxidase family enzyme